jgi:hypothetical protein
MDQNHLTDNRHRILGFVNGLRCGFAVESDKSTQQLFKGEFVDDKRNGNGIAFIVDESGFETYQCGGRYEHDVLRDAFTAESDADELLETLLKKEQQLFAKQQQLNKKITDIRTVIDKFCRSTPVTTTTTSAMANDATIHSNDSPPIRRIASTSITSTRSSSSPLLASPTTATRSAATLLPAELLSTMRSRIETPPGTSKLMIGVLCMCDRTTPPIRFTDCFECSS